MCSQLANEGSDEINSSSESLDNEDIDNGEINEENVFKILIATDIHLGYNEKDPVRGNDSFVTFEEILQKAAENNVDFLLLGGDLFHESKPSIMCYHRCIQLLKKYCLGDKPIEIQFLSDPSRNFGHLKNPLVNYEDPNMNIEIPVFSIHGNHDDPTGENNLSALNILADTGLVNYFGKWTDLNKIEIYPLLIKKGNTRLALYGLSHIKDERLSRLFKDKKVTMTRPLNGEKWFCILVLHQNRAQNRGIKNFIPETALPDFIDLVVWGHEHDCRIVPEKTSNGLYITQPGSSVATSLAQGESLEKYVGLLNIHVKRFLLNKIKLNTVRPFVYRDVEISKLPEHDDKEASNYAKTKVQEIIDKMLEDANEKKTASSPPLPLLRLVVHFSDECLISNAIRLGQNYRDKVANPIDMLSFKIKKNLHRQRRDTDAYDLKDIEEAVGDQLTENISDLVDSYFEAREQYLNVLSTRGLCEAVSRFIDRNDTDAIDDIVNHQFKKTYEKLLKIEDVSEANYQEYLEQFRAERATKPSDELMEIEALLGNENRVQGKTYQEGNVSSDEDIAGGDEGPSKNTSSTSSLSMTARGTARGRPPRGRGSRGPRRARARARAT